LPCWSECEISRESPRVFSKLQNWMSKDPFCKAATMLMCYTLLTIPDCPQSIVDDDTIAPLGDVTTPVITLLTKCHIIIVCVYRSSVPIPEM